MVPGVIGDLVFCRAGSEQDVIGGVYAPNALFSGAVVLLVLVWNRTRKLGWRYRVVAYGLWPSLYLVIFVLSGIVAAGITWFAHSRFEVHSLGKAEREAQEYVRFPRTEG